MQSLQTGMVLDRFDAAIQQMVVGRPARLAVWMLTPVYHGRAK